MNDKIEERVLAIANECVKSKKTIRQLSKEFGVCRTSVHIDLSERLYYINKKLYYEVQEVLEFNKKQRAVRGGMATQKKFRELKNSKTKKEG